jgi:hypothetical protein
MIKRILTVVAIVLVGLAVVTYAALEGGDVVIVETPRPGGTESRQTHIWFVQEANGVYLEAGHPDNPWVKDLEHTSTIKLSGSGIGGTYSFTVLKDIRSHQRIRSLMRKKYGWRDRWVSLLFNVAESRLIELRTHTMTDNHNS